MSWGFIGLAIGSLTAYLIVAQSEGRKTLKQLSQEIYVFEGENPE